MPSYVDAQKGARIESCTSASDSSSMIAHLRGRLISKHPNQAIVEAGGVGYDVTISVPTFSDLPGTGSEVALHIHTHVREDALALYGFRRAEEKQLFERLITVSGIGPKLAITILSGMAIPETVAAIRANDFARLTKIPGVGRKTAERMCVELRDKLEGFGAPQPMATRSAVEEDVISALTNLGYQRALAEKAVGGAAQSAGRDNFDAMFRAALAALSK
jgi:Holliday junction DNA helicase RuvA